MLKKFIQTALLLVVLCTTATTYAQVSQAPDGIQFQALATDANGHPAAGRVIYVKDAIVAKTATGTIVYSETFKVTASSAGIFTIVLGKGTYASGVSSIANIDWANGPFFLNLKIAVEPTVPTASWNVNNEYVDLGTSQFWSVPYALYAGNVKGADTKLNISDTASMLKPYFTSINLKANIESPTFTGTVSGITKAMVGLGNVDNTADLDKPVSTATQAALDLKANATDVTTALVLKANATDVTTALALKANAADVTTALDLKVDKVSGKALSTNDYTTAEKTKLAAITGTNTGDQDLSALAVAADVTTALALKANTSDVNAALALKANAASVANSINTINTTLNTKANTTDVNNALIAKADVVSVNNAIAALNASLVTKADNAVVTNQLGTKEDKLNKSVNVTLDAASDAKYPSVKAVKTYVDAQVAGATIADASATEKGKIQLAGDLAGTAAAPTVPGLALKAPIASPTFTGTVTSPTYASTPIALTYSGSNINWNPAQGLNASITLTQNSGLNFTAAPPVGSYGTVVLTQDATGSRTITLPTIAGATNKVLGSTSTSTVALSTVANSKDILNFYFDGTSCYWNIGQGYGAAATTGTTNLATSVNGTLAVANGGTGANSLTGLVKGNGSSALTAAIAGTDYQAPLTLTTSGTGAATLVGSTLNIPTVTAVTSTNASTLTGTVAIANGGTGVTTVAGIKAVLGFNLSKLALGDQAGQTNQADYAIALGGAAGTTNQSAGAIAIGGAAGSTNQGSSSVGIGSNAAQAGQGEQAVAIGFAAGQNNQAAKSVAIGAYSGAGHVNSSAIGYQAVTTSPNTIQLGADGVTVSGSTAITNVRTSGSLTAGAVTYPNTNGTAGQVLTANNNGNASWANPASSGVPYTGATGAVNLGAYDLTVNGLTVGKGKKDAGTAYQYNTALGVSALNSFTGGTKNTALGYNALSAVTSTDQNIAIGVNAMGSTTDYFQQSVAVGNQALQYNKGSFNTALGSNALSSSSLTSAATYLVGVGALALWNNTSGQNNTAVGSYALSTNTTGNNNTALGQGADVTSNNLSNASAIGYDAKVSASNTIQLGNTSVTDVKTSGAITAPIYASTPQTLTFGSPISWNPSNGLNASVTLTGNGTLSFSATPASGSYGTLVVTQGTGGNFTLTLPSLVTNKILGSTSTTTIALSTAAGAKDIVNFYYDGSNYFWNVGQGYGSASSLTATNIAGGAAGSIPYQTAAGATSLLAKGTDGQILTLASGVPSWAAAPVTGVSTATSPLSISGTTISLGTVPVASGGTGATSASAALTSLGAAPLASPTFTGTPAAPTATAGTNTTQIATTAFVANAVKITTGLNSDEFTATAAQTSFTLTQTALNAKVFMFINGTRIKNGAFSVSGTTVTYTAANNNSYALVAGDRIQFDYAY